MPSHLPPIIWLLAYLVGSIPFGYLVARARGVDIFAQGSGNIGATNVGRVLGLWFGILVFALDFAKGAGPVLAARSLLPADADGLLSRGLLEVGAGMAAFIGHLFPIYLRFRGGKGVATGAGVVAVLFPIPALTAILAWIGAVAATRAASIGSILAALALVAMHLGANGLYIADPRAVFVIVAGLLVIVKHRANWRRLREGTEPRISQMPALETFSRGTHVLSLGLWCGMTVFFTFVVTPAVFREFDTLGKTNDRPAWFPQPDAYKRTDQVINGQAIDGPAEQGSRAAGFAVGGVFPSYFLLQGMCGFVAFATSLGWIRRSRWRTWLIGAALVLVFVGWPLQRKVAEIRPGRNAAIDAVLQSPEKDPGHLQPALIAARSEFAAWHLASFFANLATLVLVVASTAMAGNPPNRDQVDSNAPNTRGGHE